MEKIEEFLITSSFHHGYGDGDGYGYGDGDGYGYGYGDGDGDGDGDGYGYGDGDGYGYGDGDGYGYGDGYGDGDGVKSINSDFIYLIDGVQTIIKSVKNNIAKGFIVNDDLSLVPCYIAKGENQFAHGKTIKEAINELQNKLLLTLSVDDRIERFLKEFNSRTKKYKAIDFYNWHTLLTGSCDLGKQSFIRNKNINLKKDKFTIDGFIDLTVNNYGSDIILKLKSKLNNS